MKFIITSILLIITTTLAISQNMPTEGVPTDIIEACKHSLIDKTTLEPIIWEDGVAHVKGKVYNYDKNNYGGKQPKAVVTVGNILGNNNVISQFSFVVMDDGTFEFDVPMVCNHMPVTVCLFNVFTSYIIVSAGETSFVHVDAMETIRHKENPDEANYSAAGYWLGANADLNNAFQNAGIDEKKYYGLLSMEDARIFTTPADELKENIFEEYNKLTPLIEKAEISPRAKEYLQLCLINSLAYQIGIIAGFHRSDVSYYDYLIDNRELLFSKKRYYVMNFDAYNFTKNIIDVQHNLRWVEICKNTFDELLSNGTISISDTAFVNYDLNYMSQNISPFGYNSCIHNIYKSAFENLLPQKREEIVTSIAKGVLDNYYQSYLDYSTIYDAKRVLSNNELISEDLFSRLTALDEPYFLSYFRKENAKLEKELAKTYYGPIQENFDECDKLLSRLLEPYRGKVVLLEVWGLGCGPCILASREMHEDKITLAKEGIVFLHVATEGTPSDMPGEHIKLSYQDMEIFKNKYTQAVPQFLFFDKKGHLIKNVVGYGEGLHQNFFRPQLIELNSVEGK
ncbi:MAG: hypothetical protein Q4C30_10225 [Bacteroidia bacterium]|nr:hypothetical protein [Bacteroidia bacterium]